MNNKPQTTATPETTPIFRLIGEVRKLLRSSWVVTGLGLSVALYLGTLLILSLLDLLVPLWPTLRLVALVLVVVPSAWAFFTGVLRPLFRRLGNRQVARRIETHLPGIHNRIVSCVDLEEDRRPRGYSPEFYRRLVGEAIERIRSFRATVVVDRASLRRSGTAAAAAIVLFALSWVLLWDRLPTAMARIFAPFADIPPATGVKFTVDPGGDDTKILRGDDIDFQVEVTAGDPRDLRIEIMPDDDGEAIWHELQERPQAKGHFSRKLRSFEHSFAFRVHGGGTWSRKQHITMVDRPRILDLKALVHYPEYMQMGEASVIPQPTADVTGPEESQVEVQVHAEGDVAVAEIQWLDVAWKAVPILDREERVWFQGKVPDGAVAEGNWQWDQEKHARPTHHEPPAAGTHGHLFHTAPIGFQVMPDDYLFAYVYIVPEQKPETIMLQWNDGQNWEHRAYWGDDKIGVGQPGAASRLHMGGLPPAGEWVKLEVPAKAVALDGKTLKGMGFMLSGGECYWHRAGALPPPTRDERRLVVAKTFPLDRIETSELWSGRFPLRGEGLYRVELRSAVGGGLRGELQVANQTMKEAKYLAIPDLPPQVTLERPGADIALAEPRKLPLVIAAYDDWALKHVKVLAQKGDTGGFRETAVKRYDKPTRGDTAQLALDLAPYELKAGEQVKYRVQVEDRKGQIAETQDYVVRIAVDDNAADRQLARFEQTQDAFQQKLAQLIAEQAKVRDNVDTLEEKHEKLEEKLAEAEAQAAEEARKLAEANPQAPPPATQPPKLDPQATQELAEVRQQLAQMAAQEDQNTNLAKQLAAELAQAQQQAEKLQMLPPELTAEMKAAKEAFDELAVQPLAQLAQDLRQASTPAQNDPHLDELGREADRVQAELEAMAERLEALRKARQQLDSGVDQALAELRREMLAQQAGINARGIEELRDMIQALREQLRNFEGQQAELLDAANVVPEVMLADLEKRQENIEQRSEPPLDEARTLLGADERRRRDPEFPDAPMMGDEDEQLVPQAEEDTPEEEGGESEASDQGEHPDADEAGEDEPIFEPALGGPRPKLDPRFADKRPKPMKDAGRPDDAHAHRDELANRQFDRLRDLNLSQQSLGADQQTLEALMEQLAQTLEQSRRPMDPRQPGQPQGQPQGRPHGDHEGEPGESSAEQDAARQLAELMQSPTMREALDLAERIRQLQHAMRQGMAQGQPKPGPAHTSRGKSLGNMRPTSSSGRIIEVELSQLDPGTRAIILKMQPKMREELLQGMREQGPEGYRKFIQDYFKRLSTVKQ
ncbi:MAG TPA: hypothetical protein VMV69_27645 [Pirellulales bacterium]|nr:hypothetical protein [Pirellulales bacterium]